MDRTLHPGTLMGQVDIPASKSQTIRALLIALFARGISTIHNPQVSSDTQACVDFCVKLGARTTYRFGTLILDSTDLRPADDLAIDCADSGTTLYFATALASTLGTRTSFKGDSSLEKRPARPLLSSLQDLGVTVDPSDSETAPYTVCGPLAGGHTSIRCMTSGYLSALLLACPLASSDTTIDVPLLQEKQNVLTTERWLKKQDIEFFRSDDMMHYTIRGNQKYHSFETSINGDFSSAAFFFCAAAMTGSTVTVNGIDSNSSQADRQIIPILEKMGCSVHTEGNSITLRGPARLKALDFDLNTVPDLLPPLAVAASFASGPVKLYNVPQARLKKSDRIKTIVQSINAIGGRAQEMRDGVTVFPIHSFCGTTVSSQNDPTVAMAMAIAALRNRGELTITSCECVDETFPSFFDRLSSLISV